MGKAYQERVKELGAAAADAKESGYDAPFRGYINVNLDDAQKADYGQWSDTTAIWECLEREAADGLHLSLRIDPKSKGFLASATQRRVQSVNSGLVVTARGRTAAVAWGRLLFILDILHKYKKWEDCQPLADPDRW